MAEQDMLEGRSHGFMQWVSDVRDVAAAHIKALELPSAQALLFRILVSLSVSLGPEDFWQASCCPAGSLPHSERMQSRLVKQMGTIYNASSRQNLSQAILSHSQQSLAGAVHS